MRNIEFSFTKRSATIVYHTSASSESANIDYRMRDYGAYYYSEGDASCIDNSIEREEIAD